MAEWERKRRAMPLIQKWLHMYVKRVAFLQARRAAIATQRRRRGAVAYRKWAPLIEEQRAKGGGKRGKFAKKNLSPEEAEAAAKAEADAKEWQE
eukprot:2483332-Prymnesium_polylepis.1